MLQIHNITDRSMAYGGTDTAVPISDQNDEKKWTEAQVQIDEVVDIMKTNVDRVLQREEKVSILETRAEAVLDESAQFKEQAKDLKKKYWWQNYRMWIILGCAVVGVAGVVAISIIVSNQTG